MRAMTPAIGHPCTSRRRFNRTLLELAAHYHFRPSSMAAARGDEKGRLERAGGYVRDVFSAARAL